MRTLPAPFDLELLASSVVQPALKGGSALRSSSGSGVNGGGSGGGAGGAAGGASGNGNAKDAVTFLSAADQTICLTAIGRAVGFPARIDVAALEAALAATLADLPFLAGRLCGMAGMRLSTLRIAHTGEGVPLTVVSASCALAAMDPAYWPARGVLIAKPPVPFYLEPMAVGLRLLRGKEPLLKVRLVQLADGGSILGFTYAHALFDGTRWPQFAAHFAARYVAAAGGPVADPSALLRPADRRQLSVEGMQESLLGAGAEWRPAPRVEVRASLRGYLGLARLLLHNSRKRQDQVLLEIPAEQVAELKALAAEGLGGEGVTTGDAVQAAAAVLALAALGKPLLPVAPKLMTVLVQLPAPEGYFGNGTHMLSVSLPEGTRQPAAGDHVGALRPLAGAIRQATAAFRASPEAALQALHRTEALAAAPAPRMLAFAAGSLLPRLTVSTNFYPLQKPLDLGLGILPLYDREQTFPLAKGMVVIRAAQDGGLLVQLTLPPKAARRLRGHAALAQLLPGARWAGEAGAAAVNGKSSG